jgi:probable rRNA maturation factor
MVPEGGKLTPDPGSNYLITVQIEPQYERRLDADKLHRLACSVLQAEGVEGPCELGVVVTSDEEVQALNRQYLGHDYKTDVLSFGMLEDDEFITPAERPSYLGDVVISYDRAAEQAPEYGHSTEAEVATLLVHGILHLLGYDDSDEHERRRMHARQQELLEAFYDPEC